MQVQIELHEIQARWDFVKTMFPGEIEPQMLKSRLSLMTRSMPEYDNTNQGAMIAASIFLAAPTSPFPPSKEGIASPGATRKKKALNWQYPSISSLIKEEDPERGRDADKQHLWSQSKINLLTDTLKNYRKVPVDSGI